MMDKMKEKVADAKVAVTGKGGKQDEGKPGTHDTHGAPAAHGTHGAPAAHGAPATHGTHEGPGKVTAPHDVPVQHNVPQTHDAHGAPLKHGAAPVDTPNPAVQHGGAVAATHDTVGGHHSKVDTSAAAAASAHPHGSVPGARTHCLPDAAWYGGHALLCCEPVTCFDDFPAHRILQILRSCTAFDLHQHCTVKSYNCI